MEKAQKKTAIVLIIIAAIYFCLMIPANATGAKTPQMLSIFEVDEYAQYEHVLRMLTPGETLYQSIRNFFVYLHYFYGYPFYFFSAILLFPLKLISGSNWPDNTQTIVCWLRQTVSVLPMIAAAVMLVWISTRFKRRFLSIGLFLFLLTLPGVILNNFWWHPDSLSVFFITLVFFFLNRDQLRFGRNFYAAAAACGVAVGIKYAGLYFAAAIAVYLLSGYCLKKISWKQTVFSGLSFFLIMIALVVISNPLLLLPQERAEILRTQQRQFEQTGTGIFVNRHSTFLENWNLPSDIRRYYGETWCFVFALGSLVAGFFRSRAEKIRSAALLAYLIVASSVILLAASRRLHYYLPVVLPLFAMLPSLFQTASAKQKKLFDTLLCLVLLLQGIPNLLLSVSLFRTQLSREATSPAIQLYEQVESELLPQISLPEGRMLRVFRDWKIYFPEQDGFAVQMDWEMATLERIQAWDPDLILLEQENIRMFADPEAVSEAVDPEAMQKMHAFYASAAQDQLPGYRKVLENHFAVVFEKTSDSKLEVK